MDHPDATVPKAAIVLAQKFTVHLRRSGDGRDEVLIQRARIYLYQSRLACRLQDREEAVRPIAFALGTAARNGNCAIRTRFRSPC